MKKITLAFILAISLLNATVENQVTFDDYKGGPWFMVNVENNNLNRILGTKEFDEYFDCYLAYRHLSFYLQKDPAIYDCIKVSEYNIAKELENGLQQ